MSWLTDPELFLDNVGAGPCRLFRVKKKFGSPFTAKEFTFQSNVTNHLSLVGNSFPWKKSDFDALAAFISRNDISVNCQGFVITLTFPRDRAANPDKSRPTYFWSHDVLNLPLYGLPVPTVPFRVVQYLEGGVAPVVPSPKENELAETLAACIKERDREKAEKQALEKRVAELEAENSTLEGEVKREKDDKNALEKKLAGLEADIASLKDKEKKLMEDLNARINEVTNLQGELNREKNENQALKKKVSDLMAELEKCCGGGSTGKEAWMNGVTVPANWIPFEDLVLKLRRNNPFVITRSGANFTEDNTTNVLATYFSRALADGELDYPIKVVAVEDLIPNKEKARFDPNIWGLLNNSGTLYAFRKHG